MFSEVVVFGQGYVGLPLAIAIASGGHKVLGIDRDASRIEQIKSGISPIEDLNQNQLKKALNSGSYSVSNVDYFPRSTNVIFICVPTPLTKLGKPDLSALESATISVGKNLQPGMLVIVESTIQPGTTRNFILPILEKYSGLSSGDFFLAFSPERVDPLNKIWGLKNTPKLVAGLTKEAANLANLFYSHFIDDVRVYSSLEIVETAKLLENTFRLVNISLINELAIFCQQSGIPINDVIVAASTKPYGFMAFNPGLGAGGHCIPVDPIYLAEAAKLVGAPTEIIEYATRRNESMPDYFIERALKTLGTLKNKNILVVGIAYKRNVSDIRESPALKMIEKLRQMGAKVSWHDELVGKFEDQKSVPISPEFDLAILATVHDYIDISLLGATKILDTTFRL
jgi:UDP-N-acetyl-D-glucosamine dehydrogenase